jgi:hypothetical protein
MVWHFFVCQSMFREGSGAGILQIASTKHVHMHQGYQEQGTSEPQIREASMSRLEQKQVSPHENTEDVDN